MFRHNPQTPTYFENAIGYRSMDYRWLAGQLLATLAVGYAILGEPIAGVKPVYIVGILALAVLIGTVSYHAYTGYRSHHSPNSKSNP